MWPTFMGKQVVYRKYGSGSGQEAKYCEHSNKPLGSVKYVEFLRPISNHQVLKKNFAPCRYFCWLSPILRLKQFGITHNNQSQRVLQPIDRSINQWYTHQQRARKQLWDKRNHLLSCLQVQYMTPATVGRQIHSYIYSYTIWRRFICATSLQENSNYVLHQCTDSS
jgi:hypothetical protein